MASRTPTSPGSNCCLELVVVTGLLRSGCVLFSVWHYSALHVYSALHSCVQTSDPALLVFPWNGKYRDGLDLQDIKRLLCADAIKARSNGRDGDLLRMRT